MAVTLEIQTFWFYCSSVIIINKVIRPEDDVIHGSGSYLPNETNEPKYINATLWLRRPHSKNITLLYPELHPWVDDSRSPRESWNLDILMKERTADM